MPTNLPRMIQPIRLLVVLMLLAVPTGRAMASCAATDEPAPSVESIEIDRTGTCSAWLSNGIRLHHRKMDAGTGRVLITITLAGGELEETRANRGITQLAVGALTEPGDAALRTLIDDGRFIAGAENDRVRLTAEVTADTMTETLGSIRTLLSAPMLTESALDSRREIVLEALASLDTTPGWIESKSIVCAVFPDDPRVRPTEPEQLGTIERDDAQRWIDRLCAGPMEVAIVGDIDLDDALTAARDALGVLPKRARIQPTLFDRLRTLPRPDIGAQAEQTASIGDGRTLLVHGFYGADVQRVEDYRALWIVSTVVQRRIEAQLAAAGLEADVGGSAIAGAVFPGYGLMIARAWVEPEQAAATNELIGSVMAGVRTDQPVGRAELTDAAEMLSAEAERIGKDAMYWSQFLSQMSYRGIDPVMLITGRETYESMTPGKVRRVLERYARDGERFEVRVDAE